MKNTEQLQEWLNARVKEAGCAAEYARILGLSGPSVSELIRGITKTLRPGTVDAICTAERITEEDLLAISKGRDTVNDPASEYPARRKGLSIDLDKLPAESKEKLLTLCVEADMTPTQFINSLIEKRGEEAGLL